MADFAELAKQLLDAKCKHDRDSREARVRLALLAHTGLLLSRVHTLPKDFYTIVAVERPMSLGVWHINDVEKAMMKIGLTPVKKK